MLQHTILVVAVKEIVQLQHVIIVVKVVALLLVLIIVQVYVNLFLLQMDQHVPQFHAKKRVIIIHAETDVILDLLLEDVEIVLLHIVLIIVLILLVVNHYVHLHCVKDWPLNKLSFLFFLHFRHLYDL